MSLFHIFYKHTNLRITVKHSSSKKMCFTVKCICSIALNVSQHSVTFKSCILASALAGTNDCIKTGLLCFLPLVRTARRVGMRYELVISVTNYWDESTNIFLLRKR